MNIGMVCDLAETGFGRVGRELARRWLDAGHDVRILAINFDGRKGAGRDALLADQTPDEIAAAVRAVDDDPVLSRAIPAIEGGDGMGIGLTPAFMRGEATPGWRPERLFLVADPGAALQRLVRDEGTIGRVPAFNYVPIEGIRLSPFWRVLWERMEPIAMSEFGAAQIGAILGRNDVNVVYHGASEAFYRVTPERPAISIDGQELTDKEACKEALGLGGRTVIFRADRLVERKDYPALFRAVAPVLAAHPEVVLMIHCAPVDEGGIMAEWVATLPGAFDLGRGWQHSQVMLTKAHNTYRGVTDRQLNIMHNAADIYASTTRAEGFGLGLLESARTGTPAVTTDFAAGPEVVGPGGLLVPPLGTIGTIHGHEWAAVNVDAFSAALERLITDVPLRLELGQAAEAHSQQFDWDRCALRILQIMNA